MALEFPLWLGPKAGDAVGPPFGAQQYRQLVDLLFDEGVLNVAAGQLLVTPSSGMVLAVAPGSYIVDGDDVTGQGAFFGRNLPPGDTVTVPAAPASNSRIDRIVLRVYDAESIGGTTNLARLDVVVGTAAASPVAPAIPNSAIPLARVTVAAGTSTITSAMLTDDRFQAGASTLKIGTQFATMTTAQRDAITSPYVGQTIFNTSTSRVETYQGAGTGWVASGGAKLDVFTANGIFTKDPQAKMIEVLAWGGGSGGNSGDAMGGTVSSGYYIKGGGGGSGGGFASARFPGPGFPTSTLVVVGAGGLGAAGVSQAYDPSNGPVAKNGLGGGASGNSTFGSYLTASGVPAGGVTSGQYGQSYPSSAGPGGGQGARTDPNQPGTVGGAASGQGGAGGGGGGGIGSGTGTQNGGAGGGDGSIVAGGTAGTTTTAAGNGNPNPTQYRGGTGGGGGGARNGNVGAPGGNGGVPGGGGGGGGASQSNNSTTTPTVSGAGGNGGAGLVIVITWT